VRCNDFVMSQNNSEVSFQENYFGSYILMNNSEVKMEIGISILEF
jgi:hypothetical protein